LLWSASLSILPLSTPASLAGGPPGHAGLVRLARDDYRDRVRAIWSAQIAATIMAWPFEHKAASVEWIDRLELPRGDLPVDDDWYYEMVAIRGFEKYGVGMTAEQLGEQWKKNACGSWGSSEQARLNLLRGVRAPDCGHPRYNKLWFTLGPQFSADVYGALVPGLPNLAARMAREYGHVNGYAEGTDGAVFVAGMVSLGFVEEDPRTIVRKAATLIHRDSPYRECLNLVIAMADAGRPFAEIVAAVEDRWHVEYPATNNAVANGGIVAASVWFGGGDFLRTVNLAARAADFTDADCNAANACSVVGAMKGMKCLPAGVVEAFGESRRIVGQTLGRVRLTPPVDETVVGLAARTAAIGEKILGSHGAAVDERSITIRPEAPVTQPAELFKPADLMRYWNPDWTLDRAGLGGAGGGMPGIRGITHLDGEVLATYPRDEVRGLVLRRALEVLKGQSLRFEAGCDGGRAWELAVYAGNQRLLSRLIDGGVADGGRRWEAVSVDLGGFAGRAVQLRLYQRVLIPGRTAGNAYWRNLRVE
jgi:hypothetical protein